VIRSLYGACWAWWATSSARRQLRTRPVEAVRIRRPVVRAPAAERGVLAVLRRLEPSCLERALVLLVWLRAQGRARAVVIGVTAPGEAFRAHAWLDGEDPAGCTEIARVAP
jgi:transglutaminase superfamily protein